MGPSIVFHKSAFCHWHFTWNIELCLPLVNNLESEWRASALRLCPIITSPIPPPSPHLDEQTTLPTPSPHIVISQSNSGPPSPAIYSTTWLRIHLSSYFVNQLQFDVFLFSSSSSLYVEDRARYCPHFLMFWGQCKLVYTALKTSASAILTSFWRIYREKAFLKQEQKYLFLTFGKLFELFE